MKTKILSEPNHRLISEHDMAYLPPQCKAHSNVCYSQTGTFVWDSNEVHKKCRFEFYKMGQFQRVESHTYLDAHNKLIIQFDPDGNENVVTCNQQKIRQSLEGLWVMERYKKYMQKN